MRVVDGEEKGDAEEGDGEVWGSVIRREEWFGSATQKNRCLSEKMKLTFYADRKRHDPRRTRPHTRHAQVLSGIPRLNAPRSIHDPDIPRRAQDPARSTLGQSDVRVLHPDVDSADLRWATRHDASDNPPEPVVARRSPRDDVRAGVKHVHLLWVQLHRSHA